MSTFTRNLAIATGTVGALYFVVRAVVPIDKMYTPVTDIEDI